MGVMPEPNIDEEDVTRIGKVLVPFFLFFILALYFAQYWETISWEQQIVIIALLLLIATLTYRREISEILR